jgi:hypothetical protein
MAVSTQHSFQSTDVTTSRYPRTVFQGWKEIASELDRGGRTVQRWAQSLGLPVHRLGNGARRPVFAFKDELDVWFRNKAGDCETTNSSQGQVSHRISPQITQNRPCEGKGQFIEVRAMSGIRPKTQASVLQSISDFFRREGVRKKPQKCRSCQSPLGFFEGHFSLYGTDMEWTIPLPYCPVCDRKILEESRQRPTIH